MNLNNFNPFKEESSMFPFRWFLLILALLSGVLLYSDSSGYRIFSGSGQQQWNASGQQHFHK
ncbi:hypothetical protein [Chitinophaga pinensis]|uniref:Uncharacterized protein n=1 Tax=Chitinophaga pinensis (strain ATCC 43595 / DSM 2588 / LMG 13176 / NBRC 15968 / NCIMB 11800 / UQM 2034) TaxID=485918 RepID=A0A979G1F9_CHIPD|nr:hypothetical protein [Chitinophaga pinensis]ACU59067.1 hypothetical protein Cpin_1571 [Chitinophaga pinensis DSM 2588]